MFCCGGWVTAVAWSPSGHILAYAGMKTLALLLEGHWQNVASKLGCSAVVFEALTLCVQDIPRCHGLCARHKANVLLGVRSCREVVTVADSKRAYARKDLYHADKMTSKIMCRSNYTQNKR